MVKLILRILHAKSGKIKIFDKYVDDFNDWGRIGYVSQNTNSFNAAFPATVEEIVCANLFSRVGIFKRFKYSHKQEVYDALKIVGLENEKDKLIGSLSGGQKQRVFIARALVGKPDMILLDEPTVGIDAKAEDAIYCLLAKLNKDFGITVVMVTHDICAITVHANKLACIGREKIYLHDSFEDIPENIKSLYNYSVKLHVHDYRCNNCSKRNVANK